MTKVDVSSLTKANSGKIIQSIETLDGSISSLISSIDSFVSGSTGQLQGNGYDLIRKVLYFYSNSFTKLKSLLSNYKESIISANNGMINYMAEFSYLDTKYLGEIVDTINMLHAYYDYIASRPESDFNKPSDKAAILADLDAKIKFFEYVKDKLVGLKPEDDGLYSGLSQALGSFRNFGNIIGLIPNNTYWYKAGLNKTIREHFNEERARTLTSVLDQVTDPKILELISSAFSLLGNMEGTDISKVVYSRQDRFNIRENGQLALDCSGFVTYLFNQVYGENIPEYANTGTMSQGRVELKLINEDKNHQYDPNTGQMTVTLYHRNGQSYTEVYDAYPYTGDDGKTHYAILEKSYASGQPKSHTYYNYPFEALDENQTPQAGDIYMDGRNHVRIYLGSDGNHDYYIEVHEDQNGVQVVQMSGGRGPDGSYTGTLVSHIGSHRDSNVGNMGYDSGYYRYTGESSITHNSSESGTEVLQEFSTN